jgi:hypothetical protein
MPKPNDASIASPTPPITDGATEHGVPAPDPAIGHGLAAAPSRRRQAGLVPAAVSSDSRDGRVHAAASPRTPAPVGARSSNGLVAVGPGLAGSMFLASLGGFVTDPLPVQPVKIHCPPLRADILSRERLNTWLDRASAGRVALIVAEAGFGKTTLLADWATHSRRLTAWYRLERDDRDWLTFIRHLVAGGREVDPDFALSSGSGAQPASRSSWTTTTRSTTVPTRIRSRARCSSEPRPASR